MAEYSYPLDNSDANESEWGEMMQYLLRSGVHRDQAGELALTAAGGLGTQVATGKAWHRGYFYSNTAAVSVTHSAQHATDNRIDRVVLRLNTTGVTSGTTPANSIAVQLLEGTPATTPVAPSLVAAGGVYDLALYQVLIKSTANGGGTIVSGDLTDERSWSSAIGIAYDTYAKRPAATADNAGTLYWATDSQLLYYSDGSSWTSFGFATGGPFLAMATFTGAGSLITGTGAGTAVELPDYASAPNGSMLVKDSNAANGWSLAQGIGDRALMFYGAGSDGDATVGGGATTFLTRAMTYNTLTVTAATNACTNGTFDTNNTGWTNATRQTGTVRTGAGAGQVSASTTAYFDTSGLTGGLTYQLVCFARCSSGSMTVTPSVIFTPATAYENRTVTGDAVTIDDTGWTAVMMAVGLPTNATTCRIRFTTGSGATAYIDDVQFTPPSIHTMAYPIFARDSITVEEGAHIDASGASGHNGKSNNTTNFHGSGAGGGQGGGVVALLAPVITIEAGAGVRAIGGHGGDVVAANFGAVALAGGAGGGGYANGGGGGGGGAGSSLGTTGSGGSGGTGGADGNAGTDGSVTSRGGIIVMAMPELVDAVGGGGGGGGGSLAPIGSTSYGGPGGGGGGGCIIMMTRVLELSGVLSAAGGTGGTAAGGPNNADDGSDGYVYSFAEPA